MAEYILPKRGVELIFYVALVDQSNTKLLKANPTLAAGDVKVSKDGGAFANLTTLPAVTPASGTAVKVTVSATEMTADNVVIAFIDAAGAEWCDQFVNIATATRAAEDLAFPTVSGRSIDATATGAVGVDWGNVENQTTAVDLSASTIKTTQKVDVETIKTQAVTCAAGVTVLAQVGAAAAPGTNGGLPTVDASNRVAGIQGIKNTLDDLNDLSAAGVRTAVGLASANLDTQFTTTQTPTNRVIVRCTVGAASTTTAVTTSACSPAGAAADQFKGRIITFDSDTTTAALRGQSTDITASSNAATPTFTVTALTTAPASGDTFTIT